MPKRDERFGGTTGLEPATSCVTGRRFSQHKLSFRCARKLSLCWLKRLPVTQEVAGSSPVVPPNRSSRFGIPCRTQVTCPCPISLRVYSVRLKQPLYKLRRASDS